MSRKISHTFALAAVAALALSASAAGAQATQTPAKQPPASQAPAKQTAAKSATHKSAAASTPTAPAMVDINHATAAELEAVAGIGKTYADKIIAGRPYANKQQLLQKHVLSKTAYAKAKNHIVAKQ